MLSMPVSTALNASPDEIRRLLAHFKTTSEAVVGADNTAQAKRHAKRNLKADTGRVAAACWAYGLISEALTVSEGVHISYVVVNRAGRNYMHIASATNVASPPAWARLRDVA